MPMAHIYLLYTHTHTNTHYIVAVEVVDRRETGARV